MDKFPRAFVQWFKRETKGDVALGAALLFDMVGHGPSDCIIWDVLKRTGDDTYTLDTFVKAAEILNAQD